MAKKIIGEDGKKYIVKEKKPFYKRWWFVALVIFTIIGIIGGSVGNDEEIEAETGQEELVDEEVVIEKETYHTIGETFNNESFEFSFDYTIEPEISDGFVKYTPDGMFLVVDIVYENIASKAQSLDSGSFKLKVDDSVYNSSMILGESISFEQLNPGNSAEGNIYFDVPADIAESDNKILVFKSGFVSDGKPFEVLLLK